MCAVHISPRDAVARELDAAVSIPMHYFTFHLANAGRDLRGLPPVEVRRALDERCSAGVPRRLEVVEALAVEMIRLRPAVARRREKPAEQRASSHDGAGCTEEAQEEEARHQRLTVLMSG